MASGVTGRTRSAASGVAEDMGIEESGLKGRGDLQQDPMRAQFRAPMLRLPGLSDATQQTGRASPGRHPDPAQAPAGQGRRLGAP